MYAEESNLDAIFVCLPNALHYDATKAALDRGINVFCEKPMGLSSEAAWGLTQLARERSLNLMIGYHKRFTEAYRAAGEVVRNVTLGDIHQVHGMFQSSKPYLAWFPHSSWFFDETSGGALYDSGSHLFDTLIHILHDQIAEVQAQCASTVCSGSVSDSIVGIFRSEKGRLGTFGVGWRSAVSEERIKIVGSAGSLVASPYGIEVKYGSHSALDTVLEEANVVRHLKTSARIVRDQLLRSGSKVRPGKAYFEQDVAFVKCILNRTRQAIVPDFNAVHVLEILEAIKESFKHKRAVMVSTNRSASLDKDLSEDTHSH
jgi:predicted dehydrogenase